MGLKLSNYFKWIINHYDFHLNPKIYFICLFVAIPVEELSILHLK